MEGRYKLYVCDWLSFLRIINIHSMKKVTLLLCLILASFVSCSEDKDVGLNFETKINLSAAHILDSFVPIKNDDFNIELFDNVELRIVSFVYDTNGTLIDKYEMSSRDLNQNFTQELFLKQGEYSLVSIASFIHVNNSSFDPFWIISNYDKLDNLKINQSENADYDFYVFETLGLEVKKINVGTSAVNINVDIKPITSLLEVFFWGEDMTGFGTNGHSELSPYCTEVNVYAQKLMNQVKINNGEIVYSNTRSQVNNVCIASFLPQQCYQLGLAPNQYKFLAVLPINNRDFLWDISFIEGSGAQFGINDYEISDRSSKLNMESGKQYILDLMFDGKYLFAKEYEENEDIDQRRMELIKELNAVAYCKIFDRNFEQYLDMSQSQIEDTFGSGTFDNGTLYYFNYNDYYSLAFNFDSETGKSNKVSIVFKNINQDFKDWLISYLEDKFVVFTKGTDEHIKAFTDGESLETSKIGIIFNIDDNLLMYSNIN